MNQVVRRVKNFFQPGEKEAFSRIEELARLGEESLELLVKILSGTKNGVADVDSYTARISALEKEGDLITQSLEESLGRGAIIASLSNDFERLVDSVDSILDRAHSLSRQLRRVTRRPLRQAKEFDTAFRKEQVRLIEIGQSQVKVLRRLLVAAGSDRARAVGLAHEIERLEEQGDDVKDGMLDEIYGSWEKLDFASFHNHIQTTIEADDILDLCEDASDLVIAVTKALGA
ncbi:hypothetical protein AUG19_07035 [archaeon 13_1_20CM_2_54_9]|nr:MAG: hypothetical protein AUJ07_07815 [Crenarchaeota archaeon 13_1_40CM_3_53_5]OLE74995.1 MAG: hypothetical protein AUG19_07035 [archaeon 13_1_20CM_2_54_9]TMI28730.1 MAG: DUF47 family protein [Candidatus Bathyarchaeota archaeon]TMI31282.1 MAG: DUF47 family protein [Candidatus Bathyarchaeota archaeon]